jgi:hypothetical protein
MAGDLPDHILDLWRASVGFWRSWSTTLVSPAGAVRPPGPGLTVPRSIP